MTVSKACSLFFTGAFDFDGRSSRREFWWAVLPNAVLMFVLLGLLAYSLLGFATVINTFSIIMLIVFGLFCLIELIPSIALIFRRMHDIGKSGAYILVLFIPLVGWIWYIYLVTRPTDYYRI